MRLSYVTKSCAIAGIIVMTAAFTAPAKVDFALLVNPSNPIRELSRAEVSRIFLKKTTRWISGHPVLVIEQPAKAAIRQRFSAIILQKAMRQVDAYWQEMIFSGRAVPPPERPSDTEVILYIRENPDAIGYVSGSAANAAPDLRIVDVRP